MKKLGLILGLALISTMTIAQQRGKVDGEKIEQLRIAFLTQELDLNREEGQAFWPIYNEYTDSKAELEGQIKQIGMKLKKAESVSEKDVADALAQISAIKKEMIDLEDNFYRATLPILGAERTLKLVSAERNFRKQLADKISDRRSGQDRHDNSRK